MVILAIETSCDDTGVALLDIKKGRINVLADFVSSQTKIHAPFGGVVPNLAARAHYKNLPILLEKVFGKIDPQKIDLIAVTVGPGLEPSLWAGVNTARVLTKAMNKPIVGVNHLEGHVVANFLAANSKLKTQNSKLMFPAICLIASGGHTQLVLIKDIGKYKVIGQTRDDAAGEAFDKVAKLLGLGYPGGPEIALKAKKGRSDAFNLPRPMIDAPSYDFSFSGLKTAVLYLMKNLGKEGARRQDFVDLNLFIRQVAKILPPRTIKDICASFQQAVVDVLVSKTIKATVEYKVKAVMLSGGVAANDLLRKNLKLITYNLELNFLAPAKKFCTDNAVMIGLAGYWKYQRQGADKIERIIANANINL